MRLRITFLLCLLVCGLHAQNRATSESLNTVKDDSLVVESRDTVLLKSYATRYDPRKALLYAAVLPGLGQVYNKKYWKLPLIYGGFYGLIYSVSFYQDRYTYYKTELFDVLNGTATTQKYGGYVFPEQQLRTIVDRYRRERDYWLIFAGLLYILQIVDAHVDAHLKEFDLNPNLHVSIEPVMNYTYALGRQNGAAVIIRF